jgi:spore coat protein A, manganese oxidase
MGITRREALKLGLAAGTTIGASLCWTRGAIALADCDGNEKPFLFSPRLARFTTPLYIPPVLQPKKSTSDTDCYEIEIGKVQVELSNLELEDKSKITLKMPLWGMRGNGAGNYLVPGPLIHQAAGKKSEGGRQSQVRFINRLPKVGEPSLSPPTQKQRCDAAAKSNHGNVNNIVIHLHGMNSLPEYDGYALDHIPPDYYKDYLYPNDSAGILWYHDHTMDHTASNVYEGVAGMYIATANAERGIGLPEDPEGADPRYDIPLMIQDKRFDTDGNLRCFNQTKHSNFYGDVIFVNGTPFPVLEVERRAYRFRLLNASLSRVYRLALSLPNQMQSIGGTIAVIGSDEGLLPKPVYVQTDREQISMGVAERYDIVIDFSNCQNQDCVYLKNVGFSGVLDSDSRTQEIMKFKVVGEKQQVSTDIPTILPSDYQEIPLCAVSNQRTFRFTQAGGAWNINGKTWSPCRFDADPLPNAVEIWEFVNPGSGWVHPVHPHLVRFRILDRNGTPPPAYQRGWKDVALVGEFQKLRVLMQFSPHQGNYMMHCHNLVHEDHFMMTQFKVGTGGNDPCSKPAIAIGNQLPEMTPPKHMEVPLPTEWPCSS